MVNSRQMIHSKLKPFRPEPLDICLKFLSYLALNEELLVRFVETTGFSPESLRQSISAPDTQGGLLDFMLSDESVLLAFTAAEGLPPESPMLARIALDGGRHAQS